MKKLLLLGLALGAGTTFAQKFSVRGTLTDTLRAPLPSATVMVLNPADSSLVNFGVSANSGAFEVKNLARGTYLLKITFVGFQSLTRTFAAPETGATTDLGVLRMAPLTKELDEVVIKGEKAPVTIKKDTIEFNAGSFAVKANANVEDLLKKMPGMEVDNDGNVRAQGEQVQRVTVDGREFFGRDPKLATRNLPADAVDKVQVFDRKSEQAQFTGIDDGQREKTINLELKEEKRNGAFGNVMAGVGTDDRYQGRASINKFGKGKQLSFLGMGNNVNEQGFSLDDYMNFSGGSQQLMGGGATRLQINLDDNAGIPLNMGGRQNGILTNYAGGVNFNRDLNKNKTQLSGSYFFNRLNQNVNRTIDRINYLPPDSTYLFNQNNLTLSTNDNHRVNLVADHKIDSANSLRFTTNVSYNDLTRTVTSQGRTSLNDGSVRNENNNRTSTDGQSANLNSSLLWRHRFAKKGRTLSTNITTVLGQSDQAGDLLSDNSFFGPTNEKRSFTQINSQKNQSQSLGVTGSYTEPLGKRRYLEANYSFRTNWNDVDRQVFDQQNGQLVFNPLLSNAFHSQYVYNRPGLNFRVNREKFSVTVGAAYQNTALTANLRSRDATIDRTFENFLPTARFNYDFSTFKHFRLDYETSMQEPSVQQLQPVIDNSDPLNIYIGNPALRPSYQHRVASNFTWFDPARMMNFFAFVTALYTTDAITQGQQVNPVNFIRTTRPENVDNSFTLTGNANFGFPITQLKSRFNVGPTVTYNRNINLLNNLASTIEQQIVGATARYNFTWKEAFSLDVTATLSNQETLYEFEKNLNQVYFNKTYSAESNLSFLKNYQLNASFEYLVYDSRTTDFYQTIPLLNLAVSRFLLKNKSGELRLSVNNLLDQNFGVTQTATNNYLQQERLNNLGRYFMVSFVYALNKQLNPMGARPGGRGGMRMIMR
jgi:hypothetical protein